MAGIDGLNGGDISPRSRCRPCSAPGTTRSPPSGSRPPTRPGATEQDLIEATRLGKPFPVYANDISPFQIEVARRLEALNKQRGRPRRAAVGIDVRGLIRSQVALEMSRAEYGRDRWTLGNSLRRSAGCHGSRRRRWPGST